MKKITISILIILFAIQVKGEDYNAEKLQEHGYVGESNHFIFYSNYWLNMHHFLYHTVIVSDTSNEMLINHDILNILSAEDAREMNKVLQYYKMNLIDKDLRTSEYMYALKRWMINQSEEGLANIPDQFKDHLSKLLDYDKVYRNNFWEKHNASNKKVVFDYMDLIKQSEKEIVNQLSWLTKEFWQRDKIRVDVSYYGKRRFRYSSDRPYTTVYPTHIVMNSWDRSYFGNWLEMLYHEASHHLISSRSGFVGGTISNVTEVSGLKASRQLWHAYLFYFSGKSIQDFFFYYDINDYEIYMVRNKVFSNMFPYLEKHLTYYIDKKKTLEEVTLLIIQEMNKK